MSTFFSEFFELDPKVVEDFGAFNVSLINDLPLFVDPFLLFNSENIDYIALHEGMIKYLRFLRNKSTHGNLSPGLLANWYHFKEVKQNWLGFSKTGNDGSGLGRDFALALNDSLNIIFSDNDNVANIGIHIEKCCLIANGVGRDHVSDFTVNLIKEFLCKYTESFALEFISSDLRKKVTVEKVHFNYETESWMSAQFELPWLNGDFVLLSPRDILTRDENWINRSDLIANIEQIARSIPDAQIRDTLDSFLRSKLSRKLGERPTVAERREVAVAAIKEFPIVIDIYIKQKEERGDEATKISSDRVQFVEIQFGTQVANFQSLLALETGFYQNYATTYQETLARVLWLKDVIENKGGHSVFHVKGKPMARESDLQVLFRLVWFGTPSDAGTEANDGRGPVDFKISRGAGDKTLVEMKLGSNTQLEKNLKKQTDVYMSASDAKSAIKVILFLSFNEYQRVIRILKKCDLENDPNIVLIDGRNDNKLSGSKA